MRLQLRELFERLADERDRLESLLDRLSEGVLLIDRDLNVEFANGRARELLGIDGRLDRCELLDGEDAAKLSAFGRAPVHDGTSGGTELSGQRILVVSGIPPAPGGENAIVVVVDESERERNARIQREFATNAAHELRTPLASIVTAVEMLRTGAKDDRAGARPFPRRDRPRVGSPHAPQPRAARARARRLPRRAAPADPCPGCADPR